MLSKIKNKNHFFLISSIVLISIVKIYLLLFFSSDYQNKLFIPFLNHYLSNFNNPWEYFYNNPTGAEFPYHPIMLYILSVFYFPIHFFNANSIILQNFFLKLPQLLSDFLILFLILKIFPTKKKEAIIFYFASPIIIYGSFVHSQLDLIPTALLFLSIYLLLTKKNVILSSIVLGISLSTKSHVLVAIPLMAFYVFKNYKIKYLIYFILIPIFTFLLIAYPYIFTIGYYNLVLFNPKTILLYEFSYSVQYYKFYFAIFAILSIYIRFFAFKKVNNDLLINFLGILFSIFVLLIIPAPAWYIWMFPYVAIFFIKNYENDKNIIYYYFGLNFAYLLFFIFFYKPEYQDIIFLDKNIDLKIYNEKLANISLTFLLTILTGLLYALYKFGVKSNSIYKKNYSTVIGISGDSGVGKTTLLNDIKSLLGDRVLDLEGDADHKWERGDEKWNYFTHLNPKANFIYRQYENIFKLKKGLSIERSDYDHSTGKFTVPIKTKPKDFIILSGLHPFYLPKMRKIIDFKIFLDTDDRLRKHWKILRDIETRGYDKNKIIEQIDKRKMDAEKFIAPQKEFADLVINYFTEDDFEIGNPNGSPKIKLRLFLDANIHIESFLSYFSDEEIEWDYSSDLKTQILILKNPIKNKNFTDISDNIISNLEEIVSGNINWLDDYRGFVQIVTIFLLSEKMKESI
ncbi:uridine kinase [Candidatus Poribacteria bacterium]|nr:uridine kinase [Candidatus Poribacteria bacterium]